MKIIVHFVMFWTIYTITIALTAGSGSQGLSLLYQYIDGSTAGATFSLALAIGLNRARVAAPLLLGMVLLLSYPQSLPEIALKVSPLAIGLILGEQLRRLIKEGTPPPMPKESE